LAAFRTLSIRAFTSSFVDRFSGATPPPTTAESCSSILISGFSSPASSRCVGLRVTTLTFVGERRWKKTDLGLGRHGCGGMQQLLHQALQHGGHGHVSAFAQTPRRLHLGHQSSDAADRHHHSRSLVAARSGRTDG
jgi:hypothetical protein